MTNPVLVEMDRGGAVESRHRGTAVVVDSQGRRVAGWGAVATAIFPRSAVKPLQAVSLVESGAAERLGVSVAELALACASHAGAPVHTDVVAGWLARLGLSESVLACGPHPPFDDATARRLIRAGREPSRVHNNCSGKHAGFLTLALDLGVAVAGYERPEHAVQQRVLDVLADLGETDLSRAVVAGDGCGVPVVAMPLEAVARAFARLGRPDDLPSARARALRRIAAAMQAEPHLIGGAGRFDTVVTAAAAGAVVVKSGAEGVIAAALPEPGLGLAVKIDDGAKRAADVAMAALLLRFADPVGRFEATLRGLAAPAVRDTRGMAVGTVRAARGWPD